MVNESRKWTKESGVLSHKQNIKCVRKRLNVDAARQFLEFLFTSGLISDIGYGTKTLIYSNGQKQLLQKSILTIAKSHTIIAYKDYCTSMDVDSKISDSSLWNILNEIKPSQRHALAGLDDISNTGLTVFSVLNEIIKKLYMNK